MNKFYNMDCFDFFKTYQGKKFNLVVVDLPYGQTANAWDVKIDLKEMWKNLDKICEKNCVYCFFTTTRFGIDLINSRPSYFKYDLVWQKNNSVGYLSANKAPLREHEMVYVFGKSNANDEERKFNKDLREYSKNLFKWINKPNKEISKKCGNLGLVHFIGYKAQQYGIPIEKNYQFLIDEYKINEFKDFLTYEEVRAKWEQNSNVPTYNPQKTKGKPYKAKTSASIDSNYGAKRKKNMENKTGDRHPKSILYFGHDNDKVHPTQKPIALCEWLIKSYSNKGDLVLDFTAGSGSTCVGCINSGRNYVGVEMDADIYKTAIKKIEKAKNIIVANCK